jgi:hypothetical protein
MKGATKFSYAQGGGTIIYGCLAGKRMTAYVDQYGHLGPQIFTAGIPSARNPGLADPTLGYPPSVNIDTDGLIQPTANPPTYCLLRSLVTRIYAASTKGAICEERELISVGTGAVCASWGIKGDHADLQALGGGLIATDGTPGTLSVSGADISDPLTADTSVTFIDSSVDDLLGVALAFEFQSDTSVMEEIRVKVTVTLSSLKENLTGVSFGFAIDPNGGITSGTTATHFLSVADADAFAVEGTSGDWSVGLGVYDGDGEGAILGYTNNIVEASLTRDFDGEIAASDNIRLGSGTNADLYSGNTLIDGTTNWHTDAVWRAALPDTTGDTAIFIRSPEYTIPHGDTQEFVFYIFTRPDQDASEEAGTRVWAYTS